MGVIRDTLEGYEIDSDDPYTILGHWMWLARDAETKEPIAFTIGDASYPNLVETLDAEGEDYEITTWGTWE